MKRIAGLVLASTLSLLLTQIASAAGRAEVCKTVQVVSSHRLVSIPWDKVQPTAPDVSFGAAGSKVRIRVYETLTQDASWRFHNNSLPQLIKNYGAVAGFELYLDASADFRNVLASQLVGCTPANQRLDVLNALFKAMADGTLPHDDSNSPEACSGFYGKLQAIAQKMLSMNEGKFAQCMMSHDGLVHLDAVTKMADHEDVRRYPAILVNGNAAYDYEVGAVSRRIDAALKVRE